MFLCYFLPGGQINERCLLFPHLLSSPASRKPSRSFEVQSPAGWLPRRHYRISPVR